LQSTAQLVASMEAIVTVYVRCKVEGDVHTGDKQRGGTSTVEAGAVRLTSDLC
jgi:hypothetical protein